MIDKITPPYCGRVRLVVAAITLTVAIPRLPFLAPVNVAELGFFVPAVYAFMLLPLGFALVVTSYRWRLHWFGRLMAVFGFAAWVTLAFAASSVTSIAINILMAILMFLEIVDHHDC